MSRRNQARRRRTYARRQHEVRERHGGRSLELVSEWFSEPADQAEEFSAERQGFDLFDGGERGRAVA